MVTTTHSIHCGSTSGSHELQQQQQQKVSTVYWSG